jgi:GNAT superfamily N-acetyltransferase
MGDHMASLQAFKRYTRNGLDVGISFHPVGQVPEEERKWAFELMKTCVKEYYVRGGWGWNDRDKWQELTDETSCFLLARDAVSGSLVGFVSFRFDLDEGVEVLYCYEIHLCAEVRNKGLGKFLMQTLELIAHRTHMSKVMLTVFKENTLSSRFFREKMKYREDETSPLYCDPLHAEEYTYSIFSKTLTRPAAKTSATTPTAVPTSSSSPSSTQ